MNIQEKTILAKLKQARTDKDLSGDEVAQRIGKSDNSFISRLENGKLKLNIDIINKLCAVYDLNPTALFTSSDEQTQRNGGSSRGFLDNLEYRSETKNISTSSRERIKSILPILRKIGKTMKRLKDAPLTLTDFYKQDAKLLNPSSQQAATQLGKKVACKLREYLNLGNDPIADIQNLVWHSLKVPLCSLNLERCWGLYSKDAVGNPLIIYSSSHEKIRQRSIFTIAHELGHHLLSPDEAFVDAANGEYSLKEVLADSFAQELLVPSESLIQYLQEEGLMLVELRQKHLVDLCQYFKVSYLMMLTVLRKNGVIKKEQYNFLSAYRTSELEALGYAPKKYMTNDVSLDILLNNLVAKGLRKGELSYLFASEMLDITENEVKAIV